MDVRRSQGVQTLGRPRLGIREWGVLRATQRPDGTWRARAQYRGSDGVVRPVEATGPSRSAAERKLTKRLRDNASAGTGELTSNSTVADAVERHLQRLERRVEAGERAPSTLLSYRSCWQTHLRGIVGGWRLSEVTVARAEDALNDLADRHPSTVTTARVLLSAGMRLAVRYRAVESNPIRDIELTVRRNRRDPVALTPPEVARVLLALADDQWALRSDLPDLVLWMLATSERIGNALAATWDRIDLDNARADLGPIVVKLPKQSPRVMTEENSKRRRRVIGLPATAVRMLVARRENFGISPSGLVFPNHADDGPRNPAAAGAAMKRAFQRAGFEGLTSHVLRKTVATALDQAHLTERDIAAQLGHTSTATQRRYVAPRVNLGNVSAIEALLATGGDVVDLRDRRRA